MDAYDFKVSPKQGDLVVYRGRMYTRQVHSYSASVDDPVSGYAKGCLAVKDLNDELEGLPLGDDGIEQALVLHIPLEDVEAELNSVRGKVNIDSEYPNRKGIAWINMSIKLTADDLSNESYWELWHHFIPIYGRCHDSLCVEVLPDTTDEQLLDLAKELLKKVEREYECR
jgi:hypothetical protein